MLTDAKKRKIYDQYGEEGLENGGPPPTGTSFEDILGGMRGQRGPRKGKSVLQLLEISLKDIYTGTKKKMKVTRDRICKECEGKGGVGDSVTECKACNGAGRVAKVVRMGMMITQTIQPCSECRGRGKIIKDKCTKCGAKGVLEDVKILEIDVEKGTPEGHRYVFAGEADEYVHRAGADVCSPESSLAT